MPGGIVNGSGLYPDPLKRSDPVDTVMIPTMLQISSDLLAQFSGITCLYNRYWTPDQNLSSTPLALFYVKSFKEVMRSNISKKRVILYDAQQPQTGIQGSLADGSRLGLQKIISDSIALEQKSYQMEIVLPFQLTSGLFYRNLNDYSAMFDAFANIFSGGNQGNPFTQQIAPGIQTTISLLQKAANASAIIPGSSDAQYINKNSLEVMWKSQKILTMKLWTGFDYRYVLIEALDIQKDGKEDDVFRATMTLREATVLQVNPPTTNLLPGKSNMNYFAVAVSYENKLIVEPLLLATGITGVNAGGGWPNTSPLSF